MSERVENVLLLCLSQVKDGAPMTNYIYYPENGGDPIIVTGSMTNEAPLQIVFSLLKSKNSTLDRIVALHLVNADSSKDKKANEEKYKESENISFYKEAVKKYADKYNMKIPEIYIVQSSANPEEYDIARSAVKAADKILNENSAKKAGTNPKICLYIDYNGGLRFVVSMLLNTANLLEHRGVSIEKILTSNFENKINCIDDKGDNKEYVQIQNLMAVLQSSRLVSGINEYLNYGRCGELQSYFDKCEDNEIKKILKEMEQLSYNLQMCDTNEIFGGDNIKNLKNDLNNYINIHISDTENKKGDPFSILFCYIAVDILEGYKSLFKGDFLEIIEWCCSRDFLQQAITFYAERMPIYFWDKKIYYPSREEEKEYLQLIVVCNYLREINKENKENKLWKDMKEYERTEDELNRMIEKLKGYASSENDNSNEKLSQDIVDILINNITNSMNKVIEYQKKYQSNKNTKSKPCKPDNLFEYLQREYVNYDYKFSWSQKYIIYSKEDGYGWMNGPLRKKWVKYVGKNVKKEEKEDYVGQLLNNKRVLSGNKKDKNKGMLSRKKQGELFDILYNYQQVKQQRNYINHADESNDGSKRWSYQETIDNLDSYIKGIRNFMK